MTVQLLSLGAGLGRDAVQRIAHVGTDIVVPVLVEAEGAARMLHEQVENADLVVLELRELADDLFGDEVGAARARGQGELLLEPRARHCR